MKFTEAQKKVLKRAANIMEKAARYTNYAFNVPATSFEFFGYRLAHQEEEIFCAAFLNSQHQLIEYREIFRGTIDGASVHPRVVARMALELNAAAVIFAHNHPSGEPDPSRADQKVTDRLVETLKLIDVRVLDHIVVGKTCVSFAERGLI